MKPSWIKNLFASVVLVAVLCAGLVAKAQNTIVFDDFNRASLGAAWQVSSNGGGGQAFIVSSTTLVLSNGSPAGRVCVATNIPAGNGFSPTLDSCTGPVTWTFNMRFGRTANTPSGFTAGNYAQGYVLASDNTVFDNTAAKGYAVVFGNSSSPDTFRLVAFNAGLVADYTTAGSAAGNALIVGSGAFSVTTQAAANDYYSFKVTYDPSTKVWTLFGRDDGATAFADPAAGSYTTIGTFTETTAIYRATALGRMGALWNHSTGVGNPSQFDNFKLTVTPATTPTITGAATASAFTTTYGTASTAQSFSVSGANLTADLVATATNSNFEVSSDGTTYGSTATFTQSGGNASGTLRIRVKAAAAVGATLNSQNVVLSSTGATSVNIGSAASGNSVTAKGLTITGLTGTTRAYDGTTNASFTGTPAYVGLVNGESFSVSGTAVASFATAVVGTAKTISITGYTAPSGNYTLTQPSLTADITQAALSVTANNVSKPAGTTLSSPVTGSTAFTSSGLVNSETIGSVTITYGSGKDAADAAGTYVGSVTPSAATGGTFTAGNYNITYNSGTLTVSASPTISGAATATAFTTTYGTASAAQSFSISGANLTADLVATATNSNLEVSSDGTTYGSTATFTQSGGNASGTLRIRLKATATVGATLNSQNVTLTSAGASEVDITTATSGNSVTAAALTISGLTGTGKTYDGTTNASFTGTPAYVGLVNGESFSVTGTPVANFVTKTVGTAKTINVTGYTAPSGNYSVTQPTLSADITAATLTVSGASVTSKPYDGNNAATITGGSLVGIISPDVVTIATSTGTFGSVNAGSGIAVTAALTLGGADAGNYTLSQPTGLTGTITPASQTITFNPLADKTTADPDFTVSATGGASGNAVTFASTTPSVATVSGNTVHIVGLGVASITASQAGGGNYAAATDVVRTFNVLAPSAHVMVLRIGNGSETLNANGNSVWLDQYDSSGNLVQSVSVPTNGTDGILLSGGASSEGALMRSPNGKYLCLPGYKTNYPSGLSLTAGGTTSVLVPRSAVTLDGANNVVVAATTTSQYGGNNFRGAATDGAGNYWGAGAVSGTYYLGTGTPASVQTATVNTRVVNIFNGDLYLSTGSATGNSGVGIYKFTGLPTTAQTFSLLFTVGGTSPSPYGFSINPAGNRAYVADDRANASGGILYYTNSSGTWTLLYTLGTGVANIGARGVTVDWSGANPVIYATTAEATADRLIKITDTGAGSTATTLATAGSLKLFRGVAFAPVPVIGTQPASQSVCPSSTATFTAAASGTPTPTAQWQVSTDSGATFTAISGATSSTFTTNAPLAANGNQFRVVFNNVNGAVTSSVVSLTVSQPTASGVTLTANQGAGFKFTASDLLTNTTGAVAVSGVSSPSANGSTVSLSGGKVVYAGPLTNSDSFTYTVTNTAGCSVTATVNITMVASTGQTSGSITTTGGSPNLTFYGVVGNSYIIQVSTDLGTWTDVTTVTAGSTGVITYTDTAPPTPAAYYRLKAN